MIVQNTSKEGSTDISLHGAQGRHRAVAEKIVGEVAAEIGAGGVSHDDDIAKVSLVGAGMKTQPGHRRHDVRDAGRPTASTSR